MKLEENERKMRKRRKSGGSETDGRQQTDADENKLEQREKERGIWIKEVKMK